MKGQALFFSTVVTAALAGLLFGFDTAVIAGVTRDLTAVYRLSPEMLGVTVSAALWGTLVGAMATGRPGDRFGSRKVLVVLGWFYLVAGVGCAIVSDWWSFLALRFVCGLAIGGSSVLAPVYIAEIAPPTRRGMLVALFQIAIVVGILVAYLSNAIVGAIVTEDAWRWKLGVATAPAVVFLLLLLRIPDSPRWLLSKGREEAARTALSRIGLPADRAAAELDAMRAGIAHADDARRLSWAHHRKPIMLAVLLAAFNQFAGINAVLYYLNDIFAQSGSLSPDRQAVMIGLANLLFTLIGAALIDRTGRKPLLAIGAAGMTVSLALAAAVQFGAAPSALLLPALIGFIAFFATSQGAVIWVYLSEIFPTPVRARGSALGASVHWLLNAIIAVAFPPLAAWSAGAPFVLFAAAMAVQLVVVLAFFPETKRTALDEMPAAHGA